MFQGNVHAVYCLGVGFYGWLIYVSRSWHHSHLVEASQMTPTACWDYSQPKGRGPTVCPLGKLKKHDQRKENNSKIFTYCRCYFIHVVHNFLDFIFFNVLQLILAFADLYNDLSAQARFSDRMSTVCLLNFYILSSPAPLDQFLGTKHPWVKGIKVCSKNGPHPFLIEDLKEKFFVSRTVEPISNKLTT